MTVAARAVAIVLAALASALAVASAQAQTPRQAPADGYLFHDEHTVDRFLVQRWVSQESPEVSPAGNCECVTVVYEGDRKVLDLGKDAGMTEVTTTADVTGDRRAELVVSRNSGGAHCCASTAIYSIVAAAPKALLEISTGNCPADVVDLDKDGIAEVRACDETFAYEFCSFAYSPFPPAVFAYDRRRGQFVLATPRFEKYLDVPGVSDARQLMEERKDDPETVRCAALSPALTLIYTGHVAEGQRLFRQLYRRPDAAAVERRAMALVRMSALWVARL